MKVQV